MSKLYNLSKTNNFGTSLQPSFPPDLPDRPNSPRITYEQIAKLEVGGVPINAGQKRISDLTINQLIVLSEVNLSELRKYYDFNEYDNFKHVKEIAAMDEYYKGKELKPVGNRGSLFIAEFGRSKKHRSKKHRSKKRRSKKRLSKKRLSKRKSRV